MHNNIIQGFPTPPQNLFKVYVCSITYNQAPYIKDCLRGVAMQETNFPYVHHVIDDCSTDGEQDVIMDYINMEGDMDGAEFYDNEICSIFIVKYKKNPNCTVVVYFLKRNMFRDPRKDSLYNLWQDVCTYEAICEGDDYWIDSKKLQKQVNFLDSNLDYGLCCTNNQRLNERTKKITTDNNGEEDISYRRMLMGNSLSALTSIYRISILKNYYMEINPSQKGWIQGDYPKWLYFAYHSKIKRLGDNTACYRIVDGTLSRPTSLDSRLAYIDSVYSIKLYYLENFEGYEELRDDIISEKYYYRARICLIYREYKKAIQECNQCPFNLKQFVKLVVKILLNRP